MLNSPNEWHNEEDIDDFSEEDAEEFEDDENSEEYSDEEYSDEEYEEDGEEEYEDEEYDDDGGDGNGSDNLRKYLIIGSVILLVFLVVLGIFFGIAHSKKSDTNKPVAVEKTEETLPTQSDDVNSTTETVVATENNGDEVSIDVDFEGKNDDNVQIAVGEEDGISVAENNKDKTTVEEKGSGIQVEVEDDNPAKSAFADKPGDKTVTVSIGDVGRKNPFLPTGKVGTADSMAAVPKSNEERFDFDVIEPPQLGIPDSTITKLFKTKVAGILYDSVKPSAIINIDGIDQLVKIGDVLSGFEIIAITKNKVVIQSDNNIYKASVGQPLNAEKVTNTVEISNLNTKFWGSTEHKK